MTPTRLSKLKAKWDELHAQLRTARTERDEVEFRLSLRYGSTWKTYAPKRAYDEYDAKLRKVGKAQDRIFKLLEQVSPRDWSNGAPAHWVASDLTWEDAVRPLSEALSIVPPLSYGAITPIR